MRNSHNVPSLISMMEADLERAKLVLKHYPDASCESLGSLKDCYQSPSCFEDCTHIDIVFNDFGTATPVAILVPYVLLEEGERKVRVYAQKMYTSPGQYAHQAMETLRKESPVAFQALLNLLILD